MIENTMFFPGNEQLLRKRAELEPSLKIRSMLRGIKPTECDKKNQDPS